MKIAKILNNNVVIALNEKQQEIVVMGRGLAFQKKAHDDVDITKIEKIYELRSDELTARLSELLSHIPISIMKTCDEIIQRAKYQLGELNESLYIVLTDHCNYAIERQTKGLAITNTMLWEIQRLYPKEYQLGLDSLALINEKHGIELPVDEAGFIALHFVNAQLTGEMPVVIQTMKVMQEIINIVKYNLKVDYHEETLSYQRFITHLKFFAHRMMNNTPVPNDDASMHLVIKENYSTSWRCVEKISQFLQKKYQRTLTDEECMFLTIHIERVRKENSI
ncbi:transcriptional antiterminator BglG [Providencia rettgeri]|uniref:BglG family transcription antiterminator LicT n=1 Tax=Providencia TaxID=586 RepID=UPI0008FB9883|nr:MULTISPECIES: transcriptional antiterminator BglG [Providencia]AVL73705.1 PRD domain-containing protein [Providencia rettgeri]EJD6540055.1 transcriptional antiterminator BglG [Providencia rettgeri]EKH6497349.1 transcriptional antiterminator BglG [Providencia rettgeri]ELQ1457059.1 transcriptional antiterminator BglG [Providencia rettgeri]ELR5053512.1 transcriptional antiterminator BglG [Providencia rettgeri]